MGFSPRAAGLPDGAGSVVGVQAAIYLRGDADERERQRLGCVKLAEEESLEVTGTFADEERAHEAYDNLIAAILAGRAQTVVAFALDRLAPAPDPLRRLVAACDIAGIGAVATAGGLVRLSTLRTMAEGG